MVILYFRAMWAVLWRQLVNMQFMRATQDRGMLRCYHTLEKEFSPRVGPQVCLKGWHHSYLVRITFCVATLNEKEEPFFWKTSWRGWSVQDLKLDYPCIKELVPNIQFYKLSTFLKIKTKEWLGPVYFCQFIRTHNHKKSHHNKVQYRGWP